MHFFGFRDMTSCLLLAEGRHKKSFGERDYMFGTLEDFKGEIGYKSQHASPRQGAL